jgi:hypothetical protein
MMRWLSLIFGIVCGTVIVAAAARFGFRTSDNDADGIMAGFLYASITIGGLVGHPLAIRVSRKSRATGIILMLVSFCALLISLSNSLGALAGRGNELQAKRMQVAETVRAAKRSLERAEREREGLQFTPTNAEAVKAAKSKADAATATKEAECRKRGDKCREREADESRALEALEAATREKAVTERALALDTEIGDLKAKIDKVGPVLDANPQGSAFARLLNLPETEVNTIAAWQSLAMVIMIELLIVSSLIAFEVLGKDAAFNPVPEAARKPMEAMPVLEIIPAAEDPKAFPAPPKPRLIASRSDPLGNVALIITEVMEPGRGKVEIAEAFKAYAEECRNQGKTPVSVGVFTDALERFCQRLGIQIEPDINGRVYLKKVRLKKIEKKAASPLA